MIYETHQSYKYDTETGQLDNVLRICIGGDGEINSVLITPTLMWINAHLLGGELDYVRVAELDLEEYARIAVRLVGDSRITIDDNLQSLWIPPYFFPFSSAAYTHYETMILKRITSTPPMGQDSPLGLETK